MRIDPAEIRAALDGMDGAHAILERKSRAIVEAAKGSRSLRALARSVGLSPTYLSLVGTGQTTLSPGAARRLLAEIESHP